LFFKTNHFGGAVNHGVAFLHGDATQEDDVAPVARALAPPVAPPCMAPHCGAVDHGGDIGPLRAFVEVRTKLEP
jgi:hypothetical protein